MKKITLGILGGLGPMSSVYFYEMLTSHTKASTDQEHLDILLSSRATTPDRTGFILGTSAHDPLPAMEEEAKKLEAAGAQLLAISCNTAHCFYEGIQNSVNIPIISIIKMTAEHCKALGVKKVGLLATEGTVASGAYKSVLDGFCIECEVCTLEEQSIITDIIYGQIKKGIAPDIEAFLKVTDALKARGCERIILGCTELSLLKKTNNIGSGFIDSLEVLALCAIRLCGKETQGFDNELEGFCVPDILSQNRKGNPKCC